MSTYKQDLQDEMGRIEIQIELLKKDGHDDYSTEITMRQDYLDRLKREMRVFDDACASSPGGDFFSILRDEKMEM